MRHEEVGCQGCYFGVCVLVCDDDWAQPHDCCDDARCCDVYEHVLAGAALAKQIAVNQPR